jgi:hypothetical protein
MSTEHTYTTAELNSSDNDELLRRLQANGYTAESVEDGPGASEVTARVAEDSVSSDDMKTALNTSFTPLALSPSSASIASDGADSQVVNVTGPANATVKLSWAGVIPVSATQITLDGAGDGSFTVGPFVNGQGKTSSPLVIEACAQGEVCKPAYLQVTTT